MAMAAHNTNHATRRANRIALVLREAGCESHKFYALTVCLTGTGVSQL